jgi:hypothetical protein
MTSKAAVCLARSRGQAESLVRRLFSVGFSYGEISVLFSDPVAAREIGRWRSAILGQSESDTDPAGSRASNRPAGAGDPVGAVGAYGVLGGALGLLAGIGSFVVPGIGAFIAAGPILSAVGGVAVGITVGGLSSTLIRLGMPEYEARAYDGMLREGRVLVSVHSEDRNELEAVTEIFKTAGVDSISLAGLRTRRAS